jgi:predicted nucleic acid-binding protein
LTPTSSAIRAFIDSTVLFAACASAVGASRLLLDKGFAGIFQPCFSTLVLLETERNLAAKRPQALAQFVEYRSRIAAISDPPVDFVQRAMHIVAAKDAPIVAAAFFANAHYLLTLDQRHILAKASEIASEFGLTVLTPGQALARI